MNRKFIGKRFRTTVTVLLPALAFLMVPAAHGALLGVQQNFPDFTSVSSTDINNVFVNTDPTHRWRMTINGSAGTDLVNQTFKFSSTDDSHRICTAASTEGSATCGGTPYTLIAYFDASGNFTTGSITIDGKIDANATSVNTTYQVDSDYANTGSLLDATLTEFGFLGADVVGQTYDSLLLDFRFTLDATTADINQLFGGGAGGVGGAKWNGRVGGGTSGVVAGSALNRDWVQSDFAHAFNCTGATGCNAAMDTFVVPLPAAVWLFGSGLVGLFGVGARSQKKRNS